MHFRAIVGCVRAIRRSESRAGVSSGPESLEARAEIGAGGLDLDGGRCHRLDASVCEEVDVEGPGTLSGPSQSV